MPSCTVSDRCAGVFQIGKRQGLSEVYSETVTSDLLPHSTQAKALVALGVQNNITVQIQIEVDKTLIYGSLRSQKRRGSVSDFRAKPENLKHPLLFLREQRAIKSFFKAFSLFQSEIVQ
jgi:hypothetical protein